MEKIKEFLLFINAHRDGCCGSFIAESMEISEDEVLDTLKKMHQEELIEINNAESPTDEEFLNSLILISGGYYHPDYSNIY